MRRREKGSREAVLIGFMGAGKSSVGRILATRLGADFVDVDETIEKSAGKSIREVFGSFGEGPFREMEKAAVRDAVSMPGRVVAAGGGSYLDEGNRRTLSAYGPVIFLDVSCESVLERLAGDRSRPLLPYEGEKLRDLMEKRRPAYRLADFTVATDGRSASEVAEGIIDLLASCERPPGKAENG